MTHQLPRIESLKGEQLSSVIFVADYVQFDFNGPLLTAFSSPIVRLRGDTFRFPGAGSRDALCTLIHRNVKSALATDGRSIDVTFDAGDTLTVPLDAGSRVGPEAATFRDPRVGGLLVW